MSQVQHLSRANAPKLAFIHTPGTEKGEKYPIAVFLGGYRSDMSGTKATFLEAQCQARGQAFLRLDYAGHGLSEGEFEDGTISRWKQDALDVIDHVCGGNPVVLIGSSMGGWIALLAALERAGLVKGLVGIAAAPDFTEDIYARLTEEQKQTLNAQGRLEVPNDYSDEPYAFTRILLEDGKDNLLLGRTYKVDFPLRLIQGMQDADVPWETAVKIQKAFEGPEVDVVFIDDGDHRLSRPEDLELIDREVKAVSGFFS